MYLIYVHCNLRCMTVGERDKNQCAAGNFQLYIEIHKSREFRCNARVFFYIIKLVN